MKGGGRDRTRYPYREPKTKILCRGLPLSQSPRNFIAPWARCSERGSLLPTIIQKGCPHLYTPLLSPFWNELIFTVPRNKDSIVCRSVSSHVSLLPPSKSREAIEGIATLPLAIPRWLFILSPSVGISINHHFQVDGLKSGRGDHVQRSWRLICLHC